VCVCLCLCVCVCVSVCVCAAPSKKDGSCGSLSAKLAVTLIFASSLPPRSASATPSRWDAGRCTSAAMVTPVTSRLKTALVAATLLVWTDCAACWRLVGLHTWVVYVKHVGAESQSPGDRRITCVLCCAVLYCAALCCVGFLPFLALLCHTAPFFLLLAFLYVPSCTNRQAGVEFVFVSACYSKRSGEAFVKAGVPHVVCVNVEDALLDSAAITFTRCVDIPSTHHTPHAMGLAAQLV